MEIIATDESFELLREKTLSAMCPGFIIIRIPDEHMIGKPQIYMQADGDGTSAERLSIS